MLEQMADSSGKSRVRDEIDANLKRVYEETLKSEVPDRFKELLDQLRRNDPGKDGNK